MNSKISYSIIIAAIFIASLIIHLPISLFQSSISETLGNNISLQGLRGSLWQGEVESVKLKNPSWTEQQIKWQLHPISLLTGSLTASISSPKGRFELELEPKQVKISELRWQQNASAFSELLPIPIPLNGNVQIALDQAVITEADLLQQLDGYIKLVDGNVDMGTQSYDFEARSDFSSADKIVLGEWSVNSSEGLLKGELTLEQRQWAIKLLSTENISKELSNALAMFGAKKHKQQLQWQQQGQLSF